MITRQGSKPGAQPEEVSYDFFSSAYPLSATFSHLGQNVHPGSEVDYRGVQVGKIKDWSLVDRQVKVRFSINPGFKVPADATATLEPQSVFGSEIMNLDFPNGQTGPFLSSGGQVTHTATTDQVQDFINSALLGMLVNVMTLAGMIGVMFYLNWRFTLIALSVSPWSSGRSDSSTAQPIAIVRIGPDHQRFSFMLEPDEDRDIATDPERVWRRVADYLTPADAELIRVANYVFRSRVAERWREGRVLLAGDAAHEMPPFLAQGMCSGMRDAHNIAWKLDLVLRMLAPMDLLDTYQAEREPHVRFITEKAIELGRVQTLRDPAKARERDDRLLRARAENRAPEKLRYPPLAGAGLAARIGAPHAGEFFVQGRVAGARGEGLFDDVVGQGPCIVARNGALATLGRGRREEWEAIGGRLARLGESDGGVPPDRTAVVADRDGTYAAWFEDHGCEAAVVRPDWYLFGTADRGERLPELVDATLAALGGSSG